MSVTINLTSTLPITSAPTPVPDPQLYEEKTLQGGRKVWVSAPQPDKLVIAIPISPYVYADYISPKVSVAEFRKKFGDALEAMDFMIAEHVSPPVYHKISGDWLKAQLAFGAREARVHFKYETYYGGSIRVHMNPRKLGKDGFKKLRSFLSQLFNVPNLLKAASIKQLDIAVDCVGLKADEVIVWHKKQCMRTMYIGPGGSLETLNIHRKPRKTKQPKDPHGIEKPKLPKKRAGAVLVSIYDRVRYAERLGKEPPFGPASVTRIELARDYFKKTRLADLPDLKDLLVELRAGYTGSQVKWEQAKWRSYMAACRSVSQDAGAAMLKLSYGTAAAFKEALLVPNPNLVKPTETWKRWHLGLAETGILQLLANDGPTA